MRASGTGIVERATRAGNHVAVPLRRRLGLGDFLRLLARQARKDHLQAYAGNVTFRALFAVPPALIALLWLLQVMHAGRLVNTLLDVTSAAVPESAADVLREQVSGAPHSQASGALTFGALISLVVALWALSSAVRATMEALTAMYAVEEGRPLLRRLLISLSLSLAVVALLVAALVLVVFGAAVAERMADAAGLGLVFRWAWVLVTWPVLAVLVGAVFTLVYYVAPDVEQRFCWVSPGSAVAAGLWLLFAALFSLYVNNFADPNQAYGALAGIAVLMIYLYCSAFILLLGAEINQIIEIRDPRGKDEGEKAPGVSPRGDEVTTSR